MRSRLLVAALMLAAITAGGLVAFWPHGPGGSIQAAGPPPASDPSPSLHANPFAQVTAPSGMLAAVYDLRTGQLWDLGHGRPQAEASIVKLDILQALLARHGTAAPVAAAKMMEDSDNGAATALWTTAGGAAGIGSYNTLAGLKETSLSRCVHCPGFPWPGWGLTTTTPDDQITLLRQLVAPQRPLLTPAERSYVLGLMEHVTPAQRWGVSGGVPPGVTVALKNGWLPMNRAATNWQVNSIGWINGNGRDYLIAILTTHNPTEQAGITQITRLAGHIYQSLR
jgi:hypothetical protein